MATDPKTGQDIVLVLQGGGALGAYQAGLHEAMCDAGYEPGWVAGISIGAINAAIIAGNSTDKCIARLREFWEQVSSTFLWKPFFEGDSARPLFTTFSSGWFAAFGVPGFFKPRLPPPFFPSAIRPEELSYYSTLPLKLTLERLIDFDRINAKKTRLSLGAVNVKTGNFTYFDNRKQTIRPEHVMASGAIPPGFPPIEIDGEFYWDGGLVSNTPIQYVLDEQTERDLLICQVDLFAARGDMPTNMMAAAEREKDIRYSSRTRMNTDLSLKHHQMKSSLRRLLDKLPNDLRKTPEFRALEPFTKENAITVVHFINRRRKSHSNVKDYEFSRFSMLEHWAAGRADAELTLNHKEWIKRRVPEHGIAVFDLGIDKVTYTGADGTREIVDRPSSDRGQVVELRAKARMQ
jgi:NTE family protein